MKRLIISLALITGVVTTSCRKETIIERVEVQKGNKILSGTGAPEATLGEEGDYYLDLTNADLYGAKSKSGWGLPLSLKGTPGANGQTPRIGENGNWYVGDTDLGVKAQGAQGEPGTPGTNGQTPRIGENGNWYVGDIDLGVKAKGADGVSPHIGENGHWFVGSTDLGVRAQRTQEQSAGQEAQGNSGSNGVLPHIGPNGHWFVGTTDTGVKAQGEQGVPGANGRDGNPGAPGREGEQGAPGRPGSDGESPHIGPNGHWFVGTQDTGVKAQGEQGVPGANGRDGNPGAPGRDGAPGRPGSNGVTPHIGPNGHWFVGTQDTGVKAQGAQGIPGTNGRDGKDGSKIYGDTGAPANSRGNEGDWYIDTQNKRLYGPKTATGWPTTYMSLTASEGQAQSGHSNDYDLSPDGKTLKFWKNRSTTTLDMEADPILKNVTTIDDRAFYGQTNLTSVKLPKKLKVIGEAAFQYCGLTTITIPENVVIIKRSAFYSNQITMITFESVQPPSALEYSYSGIFLNNRISTIYIPAGSRLNYSSLLSSIPHVDIREKS